jgi:hypothetical protein
MGFQQIPIRGNLSVTPFANPDGPQSPSRGWVFIYESQWYYPLLSMSPDGDLERVAIQVDPTSWDTRGIPQAGVFSSNVYPLSNLLHSSYPTCPKHHLYHPYEILAELGAIYLTSGNTGDPKIDNFFQSLESKIIQET